MCGIFGVVGANLNFNDLAKTVDTLKHRGPDDTGSILIDNSVFLGHARLSIIDLSSAGNQPMCNEDQTVWITYNGEIYNFLELRKYLEKQGHKFKSRTDTEVILHLYEEKGQDCLEDLNGMFAFALWDKNKKLLFLARDRLGIKPLYYSYTNGNLIFASEIKALFEIEGIKREVDLQALDQYLTFLWVPDPKTIFKGIYKLPPGHYLIYKDKEVSIKEYWDLNFTEIDYTEKEWIEKILSKLEEVVKRHLISDVPLGVFLSGGIDSSTILAFMSKILNKRIKAYTTIFREEDMKQIQSEGDLQYARLVAKAFNAEHTEIKLGPNIVQLLPTVVYQMDEPVADVAPINTYLICQAAKGRLKVLLSGIGADEIFAGYPWDLGAKLLNVYGRVPKWIDYLLWASTPVLFNGMNFLYLRRLKKFIDIAHKKDGILGFRTFFTHTQKDKLYTGDLQENLRGFDAYQKHREYLKKVKDKDDLTQMLYLDIKTFLPCLNLAYTDKMSMANSIEVRVPFLDYELVEFAASMPSNLKIKWLRQKYIYKKAVETLLPQSVIKRRKLGFGAPIGAWRDELRPLIDDLLSEESVKKRGYFNYDLIRQIKNGSTDNWINIWQLLILELWHRIHIDRQV